MFEFLLTHNNTENPTIMTVVITVLSAFFLSSLVVITYELTTKSVHRSLHFLQAMALISIVAATVMQAIGDSLARGLGMLGALAIIRFRTSLSNPRNMTFMFASLATGIACGVFGFTTAFIGTIGFCIAAFVLHFSPLGRTEELIGKLKIEIPLDSDLEQEIERILKKYCRVTQLEQVRFLNLRKTGKTKDIAGNVIEEVPLENLTELNYLLRVKNASDIPAFTHELEGLNDLRDLRLRFGKEEVAL